jgi:hypothetical protein
MTGKLLLDPVLQSLLIATNANEVVHLLQQHPHLLHPELNNTPAKAGGL